MFCTTNGKCPNDFIRELILNKDMAAKSLGNIKISMVVNVGSVHHTSGVVGKMHINLHGESSNKVAILSDIMYIDSIDGDEIAGVDISNFIQYHFDEEVQIRMKIPVMESNSFFPGDFRTKNEIEMVYNEVKKTDLS